MLDRFFRFAENGTSVRTEVLAGVTTFLTMAYIIFVQPAGAQLDTATVAQTSKSAVSRVSKPAGRTNSSTVPTWKSAIQQVWKPALRAPTLPLMVVVSGCAQPAVLVLYFVFVQSKMG